MRLKILSLHIGQSILGILVEIGYSFAIILSAIGIIYLILLLKWFSVRA